MIIKVIDQFRILVCKAEDQSPVLANSDRPEILQFAFQLVQPPSRDFHCLRAFGGVQRTELALQLLRMVWLNAFQTSRQEKPLDPFVPE